MYVLHNLSAKKIDVMYYICIYLLIHIRILYVHMCSQSLTVGSYFYENGEVRCITLGEASQLTLTTNHQIAVEGQ